MSKSDLIKHTISETALLNRYLKSRGINPGFVSKDQKVAHSKTNQFKVWMRAHVNDPVRESITTELSPTQKRLNVLKTSVNAHKEVRTTDGKKILHAEAVDKKDTITFDIPLLIRVLEFAREELKSDIDLHQMVERLLNMRSQGTLSMDEYQKIVKEEWDQLNEVSKELATGYMHSAIRNRSETDEKISKASEKQRKGWSGRRHKTIGKLLTKSAKRTAGIDRALNRLTKEETVKEAKEGNYGGDYQASVLAVKAKAEKKPVDMKSLAARMQASYKRDKENEKPVKEGYTHGFASPTGGLNQRKREDDEHHNEPKPKFKAKELMDRPHTVHIDNKPWKKFDTGHQAHAAVKTLQSKGKKAVAIAHFKESLEPQAACNCASDGANNPDDTIPAKRSTAKRVKLLLGDKKKPVSEEMYDHEKEDKSTAPVGKTVKLQKPGVDAVTKEAPKAAAVLTGGKTMTGEPRDTIEIDPMMKMRKQSPDSQKSV